MLLKEEVPQKIKTMLICDFTDSSHLQNMPLASDGLVINNNE